MKSTVRTALERNATSRGPLDASALLQQLNDEELCELFSQYPKCTILILRRFARNFSMVLGLFD